MNKTLCKRIATCALLAAAAGASMNIANAQSLDSLKGMAGGATGGSSGGGLGALGGALGGGSLSSGSMGNAAGLIEYCLKNKYLSGSGASQVKDGLMGKMPGGEAAASKDTGYLDGAKGILTGSDGKKTDLTGGMTDSIKKQACDVVLKQAQSML